MPPIKQALEGRRRKWSRCVYEPDSAQRPRGELARGAVLWLRVDDPRSWRPGRARLPSPGLSKARVREPLLGTRAAYLEQGAPEGHMSARLLAQLRQRGIQVGRVGDELEVTAPAAVLTAETVAYIREHKEDLLAATIAAPLSPSFPTWPPSAVSAAVEARAIALREAGLSTIGAERQAAEEVLRLDGVPAHESARCNLHDCSERRVPGWQLYRCPACVPELFAQRRVP